MEIHLTKKADLEFPDVAIATAIEEPSYSAATHLQHKRCGFERHLLASFSASEGPIVGALGPA